MSSTANSKTVDLSTIDEASLTALREMTEEFFDAPAAFEEEFDPENPSDHWIAVLVPVSGESREIAERMVEWHRRVNLVCPEIHDYLRLAAYVP